MASKETFELIDVSYGHSPAWVGWIIVGCLVIAFFISVVVLPLQRNK